jgi:hypothetical protein
VPRARRLGVSADGKTAQPAADFCRLRPASGGADGRVAAIYRNQLRHPSSRPRWGRSLLTPFRGNDRRQLAGALINRVARAPEIARDKGSVVPELGLILRCDIVRGASVVQERPHLLPQASILNFLRQFELCPWSRSPGRSTKHWTLGRSWGPRRTRPLSGSGGVQISRGSAIRVWTSMHCAGRVWRGQRA